MSFNVEQLKTMLVDVLEKVASGELTPASANSASNLAGKLLQSVKMEMDYAKLQGASPNLQFFDGLAESMPKHKLIASAAKTARKVNPISGEVIDGNVDTDADAAAG